MNFQPFTDKVTPAIVGIRQASKIAAGPNERDTPAIRFGYVLADRVIVGLLDHQVREIFATVFPSQRAHRVKSNLQPDAESADGDVYLFFQELLTFLCRKRKDIGAVEPEILQEVQRLLEQ